MDEFDKTMENIGTVTTMSYNDKGFCIVDTTDGAWFVLRPICEILSIKNVAQAASRLDEDERRIILTDTNAGKRDTVIVSESGLYATIMRSRKPAARGFRKWVTSEVLPSSAEPDLTPSRDRSGKT